MAEALNNGQESAASRTTMPSARSAPGDPSVAVAPFTLKSADLMEGDTVGNAQVFNGMGCTGQNVSPGLEWENAPAGTKSFAMTLFDPDAPTGRGWWHWVMFNIPTTVTHLPNGAGDASGAWMPEVTQATTDFGKAGYGGPCPPEGDPAHRYVFTVYALDVDRLDMPDTATAAAINIDLNAHALDTATLTVLYER